MGTGYLIGGGFGNGTVGSGGYGNVVGRTVVDASTILHFSNIARTASMSASWELQRLEGTSLSAANKKCVACVILSSDVTVNCIRYSWRNSAVSVIRRVFSLSFAWMQR